MEKCKIPFLISDLAHDLRIPMVLPFVLARNGNNDVFVCSRRGQSTPMPSRA